MKLSDFKLWVSACTFVVMQSAALPFSFGPAINVPTGQRPDGIAVGDFNRDGNNDMAVSTDNPDNVAIFFGNGNGTFAAPANIPMPGGSGPGQLASLDVDADGDTDIAVVLKNINSVLILTNNGSGVFTFGSSTGVGPRPVSVVAWDLSGDGRADLSTANRDGNNITVLINNGSGGFTTTSIAVGQRPESVAAGDLDGDGDADLAVANHDSRSISVLFNSGAGAFAIGSTLSVGSDLRPSGLLIANLDGDADNDIAAATSGDAFNFISVFLNAGTGSFGAPLNYATGGLNPDIPVAADFDCDNDVDIAVSNEDSNNISVLPNAGSTAFGAATILPVGIRPGTVVAVDLNNDNDKDLITANRDSNNVSVLINNSCPIELLPTSFTIARGTHRSGTLSDLFASDDARLVVQEWMTLSTTDFPIDLRIVTTAPAATASAIRLKVEVSTNATPASNILQSVEMFNFQTSVWEVVDQRAATSADNTIVVTPGGDPNRFIQPSTRRMEARIRWKPSSIILFTGWVSSTDQTVWEFSP